MGFILPTNELSSHPGAVQFHEPTIACVTRRTSDGKSRRDVIREVYHLIKINAGTGKIAA